MSFSEVNKLRAELERERDKSRQLRRDLDQARERERAAREYARPLGLRDFFDQFVRIVPPPTIVPNPRQQWQTTSQQGKQRPEWLHLWEDFDVDLGTHSPLDPHDLPILPSKEWLESLARFARDYIHNEEDITRRGDLLYGETTKAIFEAYASNDKALNGARLPSNLEFASQIERSQPRAKKKKKQLPRTSRPDRYWSYRSDDKATATVTGQPENDSTANDTTPDAVYHPTCVLEYKRSQCFTPAMEALDLAQPIDIGSLLNDPYLSSSPDEARRARAAIYTAECVTQVHLLMLQEGLHYSVLLDGRSALLVKVDYDRPGQVWLKTFLSSGADDATLLELLVRLLVLTLKTPHASEAKRRQALAKLPKWEKNSDAVLAQIAASSSPKQPSESSYGGSQDSGPGGSDDGEDNKGECGGDDKEDDSWTVVTRSRKNCAPPPSSPPTRTPDRSPSPEVDNSEGTWAAGPPGQTEASASRGSKRVRSATTSSEPDVFNKHAQHLPSRTTRYLTVALPGQYQHARVAQLQDGTRLYKPRKRKRGGALEPAGGDGPSQDKRMRLSARPIHPSPLHSLIAIN